MAPELPAGVVLVAARGPAVEAEDVLAAARDHLAATTAVLDPTRVAGRPHLVAAARHAQRAVDAGRAISRDPAMEVLLYAAGTDQIDVALKRVGLRGEVGAVALVALRPDDDDGVDAFLAAVGFEPDDALLDVDPDRAVALARERGHDDADADDAVDWLVEDCALVALG